MGEHRQIINFSSWSNSREIPQLVNINWHKNGCNLGYSTDYEPQFDVVVAE